MTVHVAVPTSAFLTEEVVIVTAGGVGLGFKSVVVGEVSSGALVEVVVVGEVSSGALVEVVVVVELGRAVQLVGLCFSIGSKLRKMRWCWWWEGLEYNNNHDISLEGSFHLYM